MESLPERFSLERKKKKLNLLPDNKGKDDTYGVTKQGRFPPWLHRKLPQGKKLWETLKVLSKQRLHTVCEEAKCPNLTECWSQKTATFLAMGKICTRNCGFCDIDFSQTPPALDANEPKRIAHSVKELQLNHVVITMVARDDISDRGAQHLAHIIQAIRQSTPSNTIEVLTSDFSGKTNSLDIVIQAQPDVFNHNIETVEDLTPRVRHKATYHRSLGVLRYVKTNAPSMQLKSGLMLGLGESQEQVFKTLEDLASVGCDSITMGQYLQANRKKLRVKAFIHPDIFKTYENFGYQLGIKHMFCGPFVRSSYHAGEVRHQTQLKR